jgi:hypothetical protein
MSEEPSEDSIGSAPAVSARQRGAVAMAVMRHATPVVSYCGRPARPII